MLTTISPGTWFKVETPPPFNSLVWIAFHDKESDTFWVYVSETGKLHFNHQLGNDYFLTREYRYTPISAAEVIDGISNFKRKIGKKYIAEAKDDKTAVLIADLLPELYVKRFWDYVYPDGEYENVWFDFHMPNGDVITDMEHWGSNMNPTDFVCQEYPVDENDSAIVEFHAGHITTKDGVKDYYGDILGIHRLNWPTKIINSETREVVYDSGLAGGWNTAIA